MQFLGGKVEIFENFLGSKFSFRELRESCLISKSHLNWPLTTRYLILHFNFSLLTYVSPNYGSPSLQPLLNLFLSSPRLFLSFSSSLSLSKDLSFSLLIDPTTKARSVASTTRRATRTGGMDLEGAEQGRRQFLGLLIIAFGSDARSVGGCGGTTMKRCLRPLPLSDQRSNTLTSTSSSQWYPPFVTKVPGWSTHLRSLCS